jgi:N-acetylmuramoyl-L-alanine amidase
MKVYVFLTFLTLLLSIGFGFSQGLNTIVIDPGHGGKDHGCSGDHSIEKHLTLDIAYKLKNRLNQQSPQIDVKMTRTHDVFVPLEERCAYANKVDADLFISIHCNQIDVTSVNGTETYVLGENAERNITSLLKREQAYDDDSGQTYGDNLNYILAQAYHQQNLKESIQLASIIMDQLEAHTTLKRRQIKQANFKVLKGLYMPGVLIETGFLSNHNDESYLLSNRGQYAIADGINGGLQHYMTHSLDYSIEPSTPVTSIVSTTNYQSAVTSSRPAQRQERYGIVIARTIGAAANVSRPEWNNVTQYDLYIEEDTYYYIIGDFTSTREADETLRFLRQNGFRGAYIEDYQNLTTFAKVN